MNKNDATDIIEEYIDNLLKDRNQFHTENFGDKTWDEIPTDVRLKLDILDNEIINHLYVNKLLCSVEFILESLTKLGNAPNLIYDDNGKWAVVSDGFQSLVFDSLPEDDIDSDDELEFYFSIDKAHFFDTIREALYYYLEGNIKDVTTDS